MAVIPPDAGVSLRLQTETNILPVAPVKPVGVDLPTLQSGQMFTARILEVLPENTYRALVAGKELTLALPQSAASGDTLNLVVVDRTAKLILAQQAGAPTTGSPQANANTTLSAAGQLISSLLQRQGDSPPAAQLTRGQPLLPQPPANAAELAAQLGKAVAQSGLFYESHQAQWIAGRMPLQQLLQEPQGQQPPMPRAPAAPANAAPDARTSDAQSNAPTASSANADRGKQATGTAPNANANAATPERAAERLPGAAAQAQSNIRNEQTQAAAQTIADNLRPLVQQQLDAVATQRLAWHGEVWPGQNMDWAVHWDNPPAGQGQQEGEQASAWSTTVSLTTPRLGRIDATLQLTGNGVRIALTTPNGGTAVDLRQGTPSLAAALAAAGVPLLGMQVTNEEA
jgi:hypothetical protein